jgi:hypothetical protein
MNPDVASPPDDRKHPLLKALDKIAETRVEQSVFFANSPGVKFDAGKPRLELIPRIFIDGTGDAFTYGAVKYSCDNFRKGMSHRRILGACLRHLVAVADGEDIDPESGLHHWKLAASNLAMYAEMTKLHPELDDRFKG